MITELAQRGELTRPVAAGFIAARRAAAIALGLNLDDADDKDDSEVFTRKLMRSFNRLSVDNIVGYVKTNIKNSDAAIDRLNKTLNDLKSNSDSIISKANEFGFNPSFVQNAINEFIKNINITLRVITSGAAFWNKTTNDLSLALSGIKQN